MYSALLEQLGSTNPQLYELISQNLTEFLDWLEGSAVNRSGARAGGAVAGQPQGGGVQLSDRDEASITRLMELGFSRETVRQAFLACGKNEEMAANYLFENS